MSDGDAHKQRMTETFGRSAATYDEDGVSLFPHGARWLIEAANVNDGHAVLDVATGTGQVLFAAAEAVGPSGRVVGVDLTDAMLDYARRGIAARGLTNAKVEIADAEQLDFPDASFDRVLCGFGLFFFPDPHRALSSFHRVLRPGGVVGATTFAIDTAMSWRGELLASLGVRAGTLVAQQINTVKRVVAIFGAAGFEAIQVTRRDAPQLFADEEDWWRSQWHGARRADTEAMDESTRARYRAAAFERLRALRTPEGIRIPRPVLVTTAVRPG
jgi:ubiquinone/menaquinone biosynthesis C-methylase UbiE